MKNNYPLFLPSVIQTYTQKDNKLIDKNIRLDEARKSLMLILENKYFDKIVIVDGSEYEILTSKEIEHYSSTGIVIEQIKFQQDVSKVQEYGKSNGEAQITDYMLKNSRLVNSAGGFYKLSSRYFLENFEMVLSTIVNCNNVFFYYHPSLLRKYRPFVCTAFYKSSIEFYNKNIRERTGECNQTVHGQLESVFYRSLAGLKYSSLKSEFPYFSCISGTTGELMTNRYFRIRNALSKSGLLACSFK